MIFLRIFQPITPSRATRLRFCVGRRFLCLWLVFVLCLGATRAFSEIQGCPGVPPQIFLQLRHNPDFKSQSDRTLTPFKNNIRYSNNALLSALSYGNNDDLLVLLIAAKRFLDRKGFYSTGHNPKKYIRKLRAQDQVWYTDWTPGRRIKPHHVLSTTGRDGNVAGFFAESLLSMYYVLKKISFDADLVPARRLGLNNHNTLSSFDARGGTRLNFQPGFDFILISRQTASLGTRARPLVIREFGEVKISERLPEDYRQQFESHLTRMSRDGILIDGHFFAPQAIHFEFRNNQRVAAPDIAANPRLIHSIPMTSLYINARAAETGQPTYPMRLAHTLPQINIHSKHDGGVYSYWFDGAAAHLFDAFDKFCYALLRDQDLYHFVSDVSDRFKIDIVHVKNNDLRRFIKNSDK